MDYTNLPGIEIGRFYIKELTIRKLEAIRASNLIRVQLIWDIKSNHYGMYEVVCCSPFFAPVMKLMMLVEVGVAKTEAGKEFTGCPEYVI